MLSGFFMADVLTWQHWNSTGVATGANFGSVPVGRAGATVSQRDPFQSPQTEASKGYSAIHNSASSTLTYQMFAFEHEHERVYLCLLHCQSILEFIIK